MARSTTWVTALALASSVLACNALFGDTSQCSTDADCEHFGPSYVCGATGTCSPSGGGTKAAPGAPASSGSAPSAADGNGQPATPGPLASITIGPATAVVNPGATRQFTATGRDASGNAVSPAPTYAWTVSSGGTIDANGLFTAGSTGGAPIVTVRSGAITATANVTVSVSVTTVTIGETAILTVNDSMNANLLLAQEATLATPATIQSLSFYVTVAAGKVRLGVYDATGPGGGPGALKAATAEMTAVAGWNAANVITPVQLPAATYWLAYFPDNDALMFQRAGDGTGKIAYYALAYGPMPTTFSTTTTNMAEHWSFYATLTR